MACFLVPTAEAVITTIATKSMKNNETESKEFKMQNANGDIEKVTKIPFSQKLNWLSNMLWGGSVLLAFEHLWHGEVVPWFPFLTAAANPSDTAEMLHEMSTVGVSMAVLITIVWGVMLLAANSIEKRALAPQIETK